MNSNFDNFNNDDERDNLQHSIPTEYGGGIDNDRSFLNNHDSSTYSQRDSYDKYKESPYYRQYQQHLYQTQIPAGYYSLLQPIHVKAFLGLIFSVLFFPVGLFLSWAAWKELKHSNDTTGRLMSKVGLTVSLIPTIFFSLMFLLGASFFVFQFIILTMFAGVLAG